MFIILAEEDESNESIAINRTLLNQAYEIIAQNGQNGVTVLELKKLMNVDFYMARVLVRFLEKRNFISSRKVDDFRQHKMRLVFIKKKKLLTFLLFSFFVDGIRKNVNRGKRVKKGATKMLQLFNRDLQNSQTKNNDCVVLQEQQDLKLLSFGEDFSQKLRQNQFNYQKSAQTHKNQQNRNVESVCFVQQNRYCVKTAVKNAAETRLLTPKKSDEFASIRSILIQAAITGLETIWPVLRQSDLHDLQVAPPVDEVDNSAAPLQLPPIPRPLVKSLRFNQQFNVIMGPAPLLDATFVDEDGIKVEIIVSTRPKRQRQETAAYRPLKKDRTLRFAKRANLIINCVRRERILTLFRVKKLVLQSETEEGYEYQVDKKSLFNVIRVVIAEGFIKAYKVIIATQEQCLICSLDVQADDAQLKEVIDGLKIKLLLPTGLKHAKVSILHVNLLFLIVLLPF